MALDIALDPHDTGMVARYWRITQTHIDHAESQVSIWLHGWRDAAARAEGRIAAHGFLLTLNAADLPGHDLHIATTATLYEALKTRARHAATAAEHAVERPLATIDHAILAAARDC